MSLHMPSANIIQGDRAFWDLYDGGVERGEGGKGCRHLRKNFPDELLVSLVITKPQHQNLQQSHAVNFLFL